MNTLTRPTAIAHRFLNLITIQSKAVDFENVPEETITMKLERGKEIITVKATLTERTTTG